MGARTIPGEEAWRGWEDHPDARRGHALFFSRSAEEVRRHFGEDRSVDRACELLQVPRGAFRYYVVAFADFVTSDAARGDPLSASAFLRLLVDRERRDPGSVAEAYDDLAAAVDYVAARQEAFQAEPGDYGSFEELGRRIRALCGR